MAAINRRRHGFRVRALVLAPAAASVSRPRRRVHEDAFKRKVVELSLAPGASVAAIALEHGINANLLFGWRKSYLKVHADTRAGRQIQSTCRASSR